MKNRTLAFRIVITSKSSIIAINIGNSFPILNISCEGFQSVADLLRST